MKLKLASVEKVDVSLVENSLNKHRDLIEKSELNPTQVLLDQSNSKDKVLKEVTAAKKTSQGELWLCTAQALSEPISGVRVLTSTGRSPDNLKKRLMAELFMETLGKRPEGLIGKSEAIETLIQRVEKFAPKPNAVLILGESGVGKTLVARMVHEISQRPGNMLEINCGEFSGERMGSELFGHKKGAFTGANDNRVGLLVSADKGTFFFDEVGKLSLQHQAMLLKVLDDHKVRPLGSNQFQSIHARLIFATNENLENEIAKGRFREELFHRLNVLDIHVPPLRERREDILMLATFILRQNNPKLSFSQTCRDALFAYDWPGNVRELKNAITKAAVLSDGDVFAEQELLDQLQPKVRLNEGISAPEFINPDNYTWKEALAALRREYFQRLIADHPNRAEAMVVADISKARLYDVIKELGL